jgi:DNA-binding NarL/FixJ family response regulator
VCSGSSRSSSVLRPDDARLLTAIMDANRDVVIMDVSSAAKGESLGFAAEIMRLSPAIGVIALGVEPDLDVARALLERGVARRGYLLYDRLREREQLAAAIREVASGGSALDDRVVELLEQSMFEESSPISRLTARQIEVLTELARGESNAAIARTLGITKKSVEHHIREIFRRLDLLDEKEVSRRVAATLLLLRATLASDRAKSPAGNCPGPQLRGVPGERLDACDLHLGRG